MGLVHMVWINLAQDRYSWQALVNMEIHIQVLWNVNSWLGGNQVAFQGLCSMELANVGKELFRMWTYMEG